MARDVGKKCATMFLTEDSDLKERLGVSATGTQTVQRS